ncbi:DUF2254 domain-containing protein [Ramlibacter sp.]|uniref:DUF2254 domain-containing protein n=1 Tax=Ramlibacter sp. TaxID=1917967 RepID=UPI003D0BDED3
MLRKTLYKAWGYAVDAFWILPGIMVCAAILCAIGLIEVDKRGLLPEALLQRAWLYDGGGTGARTLLGAVAASAIGVAGTVFSITIAALTLAAGQMGPRLLRNFTHDRGNQLTLGAFLATFSYALVVLRSVRTHDEGSFVPHLALSVGILLAFACVGMLVYFVGHMANRINVDTVIELVSEDVRSAIQRLTTQEPQSPAPAEAFWADATPITDPRRGYLQHLDESALSDWAAAHATSIRLLVRPGSYVFPGAPIALIKANDSKSAGEDASEAVRQATALGRERISSSDLEYSVRQLVEVAVRALSPGINDPHTAISVLDRLGSSLCDIVGRNLPNGVWPGEKNVYLVVPAVDYDGLTDAMFHMIRQNAAGSPAVLIRMMEVLVAVASCEPRGDRRATLARHARLVFEDARRTFGNPSDLGDLEQSLARFLDPASTT